MVTYHTLAASLAVPHRQMLICRNVGLLEEESNPQKFINCSSLAHRGRSIKSPNQCLLLYIPHPFGSSPGTIDTVANKYCQIQIFNVSCAVFTALSSCRKWVWLQSAVTWGQRALQGYKLYRSLSAHSGPLSVSWSSYPGRKVFVPPSKYSWQQMQLDGALPRLKGALQADRSRAGHADVSGLCTSSERRALQVTSRHFSSVSMAEKGRSLCIRKPTGRDVYGMLWENVPVNPVTKNRLTLWLTLKWLFMLEFD